MKNKTTAWILTALVIDIAGGLLGHWLLPEGPRSGLVTILDTVTHMFLNLIKMIIAPLIFATLVSGIAGAAKSAGVGKLFARSLLWFVIASALVGTFGFVRATLSMSATDWAWRPRAMPASSQNRWITRRSSPTSSPRASLPH